MKYVVGIDVGGTFTDLVCIDESGGIYVIKVPSTPANPSISILNALKKLAASLGLAPRLPGSKPDMLLLHHEANVGGAGGSCTLTLPD